MRKVRQKAKKILTVYTGIIFVCTSCSKCTLYDVWFMYEGLLNFLISKMLQTFIFNLFRVFFFFHRVDMHPNIQVKWLLDVSYICKVVMSKSGRREIVTNSFRLIVAELQKSFLYKLLINGYIVRRNMQTKLYRIIIFTKKKKKKPLLNTRKGVRIQFECAIHYRYYFQYFHYDCTFIYDHLF